MIDFSNKLFFKLQPLEKSVGQDITAPLLVEGEEVLHTFKALRDMVVFTNKRIIAINVQGITGKKKDFSSLPYAKIQAFSVESAGSFDLDSELELWFSGLGKIKFEFGGQVDVRAICKLISSYVL